MITQPRSSVPIRLIAALASMTPALASASNGEPMRADLATSVYGIAAIAVFVLAYALVIAEEFTELRKSVSMLIAAGAIWILVAAAYASAELPGAGEMLRSLLGEYAELLLFLLAAMTYVNTLEERNIFRCLRDWLIARGFTFPMLFWITGFLAFCLSPVLDNLTTALVMGAVVLSVGTGHPRFIALACANIVVAANAGGAFSPFGDITTLMVWQKGVVKFADFFHLVVPSLINWLVPAVAMGLAVRRGSPERSAVRSELKPGGLIVTFLLAGTIVLTVSIHNFLHLPPVLGMMTGLGFLKIYGYLIRRREIRAFGAATDNDVGALQVPEGFKPAKKPFDIFISMKRIEWDTLLFFYGVVVCVGGLGALGYLELLAHATYGDLGPLTANVLIGLASAVVDNIPIMFAVLNMRPEMALGHWLLVTLTAGVGGSLLSIGSAAGVALMGQARGAYTFFGHLRWTWAIALGYALSIWAHLTINSSMF